MELIFITREFVKIIESCGLKAIDDIEHIGAETVWIENLSKLRSNSNKSNDKDLFYATLNVYELHSRKLKLFEEAGALIKKIKSDLFVEQKNNFSTDLTIKEENLRKVSTDVGKLYQYTISLSIKTTPIIQNSNVSNFK